MASSPFSSAIEEKRYDVFLSFRGEDIRSGFATDLYQALRDKQILTFMDHRLKRGDEIEPTLWKTIDESTISVVIFSENYTTSAWCLDELVHILDCKKRNGQIVMPIFYGIDPSIVRREEGSYKVAFAELEGRFKDRMEKALIFFNCARPENELIKKTVEDVLLELPKYSLWNTENCKGRLFAIQERMEKIENLLDIECSIDVRIIGIWGMGGIGKTTLASAVFQKFAYSHFEGRFYVWDVRQQYETKGPNKLRTKLLTQLFNDENALISMDTPLVGSPFIQDRLRRKKVLIVLDDVDSSVQLKTLVEGYYQLAPGSRIIVTSRNKQVLVKVADGICKVEGLNDVESVKLFHLHAFGRNSYPTEYYETLSERVASYADGNPLALKALGSFLHSKSEEEWESELEKLKRVPNNDILKVLRISYVGLDDEGIKNIFLDITCFFDKPFTREYAESILDGGDSSAKIGIRVLTDKSLLEISHKKNYLRMHDLIRQMGWSVVSDEHREPRNRSRLFDANDVCHVLEKNTGTASIEGILLNMSEMKRDVMMSSAAFSKMCNLRFLKIYCDNIDSNKFKFYLQIYRGLESLVSNELRYFQWDFYSLESLPSGFTEENLVKLILRRSHLKQLENHVVKAPNLESINLEGCTSLFHALSSFQNLHKLTHLNLKGCNKLREIVEISGRRGHLDIVQNLSKNICHLNFTLLNSFITEDCKDIEYLPESLCELSRLSDLDLGNCSKLQKLPPCPLGLKHCTSLETISSKTNKSYLMVEEGLKLDNSSKLDQSTQNFVANSAIFFMFHGKSHEHMSSREKIYFCSWYRGDEIPNEFSYQSMGSSMNIKLPVCWNSNDFLGVAFCIVFDQSKADTITYVEIHYEIDDGHACNGGRTLLGKSEIRLDHVLMWYCIKDMFTCSSEVSFKVWPMFRRATNLEESVDLGSDYCNIKKWGIRLIYKNDLK
ncbi:hypothetical protein FNV43_RR00464 [Rhamnella rubrinervis]|uniref:ADP-ribosyl cyclase/cyclic ADP-ribose hydrolase n=1 Tax=Rhamnella rubrinervis TaxID=2594499 RepID=A0A8K0HMX4_9ROSA|nr:hypothetical protein FNV43_RR00464 [Rhamnella rubrinervis]